MRYQDFSIRPWQGGDRQLVAALIQQVLLEYGLSWEPDGADRDVLEVETAYFQADGEFWVVEQNLRIVGTAAYYPIQRGERAVEIRKMYLTTAVRGRGLGKFLLQELEKAIFTRGYRQIWIETASVLEEAVKLYRQAGYQPATGVETPRCDMVYYKQLMDS